jgi:hypothetical protein
MQLDSNVPPDLDTFRGSFSLFSDFADGRRGCRGVFGVQRIETVEGELQLGDVSRKDVGYVESER